MIFLLSLNECILSRNDRGELGGGGQSFTSPLIHSKLQAAPLTIESGSAVVYNLKILI